MQGIFVSIISDLFLPFAVCLPLLPLLSLAAGFSIIARFSLPFTHPAPAAGCAALMHTVHLPSSYVAPGLSFPVFLFCVFHIIFPFHYFLN